MTTHRSAAKMGGGKRVYYQRGEPGNSRARDYGKRGSSLSQENESMERHSAGSEIARDESASLFQPDSLLSAQYFANLHRKTLLAPEKNLMLAILEDAIANYQNNLLSRDKRGKRLFADAEDWIIAAYSDWIFSFTNVCETLGFNPAYVRQGLLRWKEKIQQNQSRRGVWERKTLAV